MLPRTAGANAGTRAASTSTAGGRVPGDEQSGHQDNGPAGPLATAAAALARINGTAREGGTDTAAALAAITAARELAAELEHGELAFIEAARSGGATWSQIAAAMGARNRQTAQKRHADLARRCPRPPSVDTPLPPEPCLRETRHDDRHPSTSRPGTTNSPAPARAGNTAPGRGKGRPRAADGQAAASSAPPGPGQRKQALPTITSAVITESRYELVRAPGYRETRTWHVTVDGTRVGLVRPTWRGERSRPGWEAADNTGLALPPAGIGRITSGGNARTRDAAAVSLLHALQRQQENDRKRKHRR
jgi:hypothetical protein